MQNSNFPEGVYHCNVIANNALIRIAQASTYWMGLLFRIIGAKVVSDSAKHVA
jgi:hypothetical protein